MNRTRSTLVAGACAAVLALAGASASMAQSTPTPTPAPATSAAAGQAARDHARPRDMTPEQRQQWRQQKHQQRAAALQQKLALTAEQQPAWNAFQQAMRPGERHARLDARGADDWKQLSTPERLDRMRALQAQRAAEFDRRADAVKAFYATLRPEQQKTFDAEGARMFARFGHGGPRGGHHGMHHGERHAGGKKEGHGHHRPAQPHGALPAPQPQAQ